MFCTYFIDKNDGTEFSREPFLSLSPYNMSSSLLVMRSSTIRHNIPSCIECSYS